MYENIWYFSDGILAIDMGILKNTDNLIELVKYLYKIQWRFNEVAGLKRDDAIKVANWILREYDTPCVWGDFSVCPNCGKRIKIITN